MRFREAKPGTWVRLKRGKNQIAQVQSRSPGIGVVRLSRRLGGFYNWYPEGLEIAPNVPKTSPLKRFFNWLTRKEGDNE